MEITQERILNFISDGNGDGNGNGYGDGLGYGIKSINGMPVSKIDNVPTIITQIRDNIAKGHIVEHNTVLNPCYVIKHENLFAHGETLKKARQALEEKIFANMNTDEVIAEFIKMFPETNTK